MKALALILALLSMPAFAADYTPWPGQEHQPIASKWVELVQQTCCKKCTKGQPCGNSCIARNKVCHVGPGTARSADEEKVPADKKDQ